MLIRAAVLMAGVVPVAACLVLAPPATASETGFLRLEADACDRLVEHVPDDDVAYQPGVDAHGNPVVPADLNRPIEIPETFLIPLELDLFDAFGIPDDPALLQGTIALGTVRVEGDRVTYNGQELTDPQSEALAELCRRAVTR